MSRTDKTNPWFVREARGEISDTFALATSWRERGSGPNGVRFAKREARRARRRGVLDPWMVRSLTTTYKYNSA